MYITSKFWARESRMPISCDVLSYCMLSGISYRQQAIRVCILMCCEGHFVNQDS